MLLLAFVAMLSACSTEVEMESAVTAPRMVDISVAVDTEADDDETRITINGNRTTWEVGDNMTLYLVANFYTTATTTLTITSANDISEDGKHATFRGSVPEGSYYGVAALYPATGDTSTTPTLNREDANNVFLSSPIVSYDPNPLVVTSGTEIPISMNHMMHKVDFRLSLANGYTSSDLDAENIAIEMTGTADGAKIAFPATLLYNIRSNSVSTKTTTESIMTYGKGSAFSTMLFPMQQKNVVLTFGIYINGEKLYEIRKPDNGTISKLQMSAGKSTTVNLVLSEDNRVGNGGVIDQKPITLHASSAKIKANGVESAKFSVTEEGGQDVTSQCTLYITDGTKIQGTSFSTTIPGTYTIYAEKNGIKSNDVTIIAEEVTTTGKKIVFAEGVSTTVGWYDVNKKGTGQNGDINMCWAAAASNMIQWWQDRYVAAGNKLPSTAINGPGTKSYAGYGPYELALMEIYHSDWDNSHGGNVEYAIPWYFEGKLYGGEYASNTAQPKTSGGYWKSIWSDIEPYIYRGYKSNLFPTMYPEMYTYCYENYYLWGAGSSLLGKERLKYVSTILEDVFSRGMASITVSLSSSLSSNHHSVTLWGYEIDTATGLITRMWITDSDDIEKEPKSQLLNEYNVSIGDGASHIKLTGNTRYSALYLVSIHPLSGYQK